MARQGRRKRTATNPKRVAAYARVSTTGQAENGNSLEAQEAQVRAYCTLKGLDLVAMVIDPAVSGSKPLAEREGGRKVLDMVRRRDVGGVVALKLDRLFRSAVDCLETVEGWDRDGVALHLVDLGGQSIDTSTAMGKMFLTMAAGFAELERNLISERTATALRQKRSKGEKTGGTVPYGYRLAADGVHLEAHPAEQRIVQLVKKYRAEDLTLRDIATRLERRGLLPRTGRRWHPQTLTRIAEATAYGTKQRGGPAARTQTARH